MFTDFERWDQICWACREALRHLADKVGGSDRLSRTDARLLFLRNEERLTTGAIATRLKQSSEEIGRRLQRLRDAGREVLGDDQLALRLSVQQHQAARRAIPRKPGPSRDSAVRAQVIA